MPSRTTVALGAAAAMLALELAALRAQVGWRVPWFVSLVLLQGACFGVALAATRMGRAAPALYLVLAVAALLRVGPLIGPVTWSSDLNRYVWDGRVQAAGINPYCCLPVDERLAHLQDGWIYPAINRADTAPTIYPPVAQAAFLLGHLLGDSQHAMKALFVVLEAIGIWAMLRVLRRLGRPPGQIMLYAWHPLPAWEIAGSGHVEALLVLFLPLAVLAATSGRRRLAGVALGAAVLVKFYPLALAPAFWRPRAPGFDRAAPLALIVFCIAAYLPYLGAGTRVFGYLPGYVDEEGLGADQGHGFWMVDALARLTGLVLPGTAYLAAGAALLAGLAIAALRRPPGHDAEIGWAAGLALACMLVLSPHYPWYWLWPLVPLALMRAPPWPALWPASVAPLLYWNPIGGRVPLWVGAVIYGGLAAATLFELLRRRRNARPAMEAQDVGIRHG